MRKSFKHRPVHIDDVVGNDETKQLTLCKIYVLADKLGLVAFATSVSKTFESYLNDIWTRKGKSAYPLISIAAAKYLYEHWPGSSKIKDDMIEWSMFYFVNAEDGSLLNWTESISSHPEFLLDVMNEVKTHVTLEDNDCNIEPCALHDSD